VSTPILSGQNGQLIVKSRPYVSTDFFIDL